MAEAFSDNRKLFQAVFFMLVIFIFCSCNKTKISGYDSSSVFKADSNFNMFNLNRISTDEYFFPFRKNNKDYEEAGKKLINPLPYTYDNLRQGEIIFSEYCIHCHGASGKSDAPMIMRNKFPPPPNYSKRIKTINPGKMFHSITLGRNLMPSFSDELTPAERWEVIYYVRKLAGVNDTIK